MDRHLTSPAPRSILRGIRVARFFVLGLSLVTTALADPAPANTSATPRAETDIDIAQLVRELQWTASDPSDLSMVWLLPPVLLRTLLVQGSGFTPPAAADAMGVFAPYLVVGVVRGRFDETGAPVLEPGVVIRNSVRVIMDSGEVVHPVANPDSGAVRALRQMEQTLAGTLGDLGAHTTFLLFPNSSPSKRTVFPITERSSFAVELSALGPLPSQRVSWRLPLASLLNDRVCPECGQGFNGGWTFCPWSGARLLNPSEPGAPSGPLPSPTPAASAPIKPAATKPATPVKSDAKPKPKPSEPKEPDMNATP